MQLEQMKSLWEEMSIEMDKQKALTDSIVLKMTRSGYRNKINKILIPELLGTLISVAGIVFILINFQKLSTWYLVVCAVTAVFLSCALPILSLKAITKMRSINISKINYKESLLAYSKGRIQFVKVQKLSLYLQAILLLVILPVMALLIAGKDLFKDANLWLIYAIAFPFFYPFSRWVSNKYSHIVTDANALLKELE
jgi:hypothetical protein